ncbi:hypothetical protein WMY93_005417 [Mugilogobius chulae]|uniref:Uncharacterized protein n=1 Tax=Mugilogobius chulae TaxID=88201 RepID=A0AAW0PJS1_9GOBI
MFRKSWPILRRHEKQTEGRRSVPLTRSSSLSQPMELQEPSGSPSSTNPSIQTPSQRQVQTIKRKSTSDDDDIQEGLRKKSRTEDSPRKQKFQTKVDKFWTKWMKKTDGSKVHSVEMEEQDKALTLPKEPSGGPSRRDQDNEDSLESRTLPSPRNGQTKRKSTCDEDEEDSLRKRPRTEVSPTPPLKEPERKVSEGFSVAVTFRSTLFHLNVTFKGRRSSFLHIAAELTDYGAFFVLSPRFVLMSGDSFYRIGARAVKSLEVLRHSQESPEVGMIPLECSRVLKDLRRLPKFSEAYLEVLIKRPQKMSSEVFKCKSLEVFECIHKASSEVPGKSSEVFKCIHKASSEVPGKSSEVFKCIHKASSEVPGSPETSSEVLMRLYFPSRTVGPWATSFSSSNLHKHKQNTKLQHKPTHLTSVLQHFHSKPKHSEDRVKSAKTRTNCAHICGPASTRSQVSPNTALSTDTREREKCQLSERLVQHNKSVRV